MAHARKLKSAKKSSGPRSTAHFQRAFIDPRQDISVDMDQTIYFPLSVLGSYRNAWRCSELLDNSSIDLEEGKGTIGCRFLRLKSATELESLG